MHCKNCISTLKASQNYCDECGAKVIRNRLTPKVLIQQVNEQLLSFDNKLLSTFIDLFKEPESVIVNYINGTRKRYIDVIQYFAIALTLAGIQVFLMTTFFKDALEFDIYEPLANSPSQDKNPFKDMNFEITSNFQGLIYIVSVPFSAFATWIVYYILKDRRYNYTEHLVINLYYSAQIIIISAFGSILFLILGLNYLYVSAILTLPTFIYLAYVLKRVFTDSLWETFAKFLLVMVIYLISYLFVGVVLVLIGLLIGFSSSL